MTCDEATFDGAGIYIPMVTVFRHANPSASRATATTVINSHTAAGASRAARARPAQTAAFRVDCVSFARLFAALPQRRAPRIDQPSSRARRSSASNKVLPSMNAPDRLLHAFAASIE